MVTSFLIKYTVRQETNINLLNKEKGSLFIDNIIDNDFFYWEHEKVESTIKSYEQWLTGNTSNPMVFLSGGNYQLENYYRRENIICEKLFISYPPEALLIY